MRPSAERPAPAASCTGTALAGTPSKKAAASRSGATEWKSPAFDQYTASTSCPESSRALAACSPVKNEEDRQKDIGQQTADISSDTRVLADAQAAVNEVIRNQDDCAAARQAIPRANEELDKAADRVRTPTGRTTLDGLRAQLRTISQNCP